MSLKTEIKLNEDYVLATDAIWAKLIKVFGGGPKIPLSLIETNALPHLQKALQVALEGVQDSGISQRFKDLPDLNPVTVEIYYDES
jgi:hypothetical protein